MALVIADRVRETTTTTGTGAVTLAGAATGCQAFSSAIGNGNTTYYTIADQGGPNWEVGLGTYSSSGNTLARTTVLSSSNAGGLVTFTAGTKDVFVTYPAEVALYSGGALGTPSSGTLTNCTFPNASTSVFGAVKVDGTTITASSGVISAVGGGGGSGTVTSVSVVSANGFAGSVATATTTPAITLTTSITGVLKGNGTDISAASSGTDYSAGTSALATGILKSTTSTGALSIAVAADFPTLNQDTTGTSTAANGLKSATTTVSVSGATAPTSGQVLTATSGSTATWQTPSGGGSGTVTSVAMTVPSFLSVTGSPITSSGTLAVTLSGTALPIANGGTGATTLAGANLPVTNVANTFTGTQTFSGTSTTLAAILTNAAETTTISATAATGTIVFYTASQSVMYYTSNASANWTINITHSAGTTLNTAMTVGQTITVTHMVTNGATAFYNSVVQVDGTTTGVTTKWQGGAPTSGDASAIDIYTYAIVKTAAATFTVFVAVSKFV